MVEATKKYDVIIVGAGPAGLAAAIYTLRKEFSTLLISEDIGGQVTITNEVENYPGIDFATGPDLMTAFRKQVDKFGGKFDFARVEKIEKNGDGFSVAANNGKTYSATVVILAFGLTPRSLGVPGEDRLKGRGVAFCATCDAPFYKGKTAAIVGGGNSAMEAVEELCKVAKQVYLLHRGAQFDRAEQILVDKLPSFPNLKVFLNSEVVEFLGDKKLEKILVHDNTLQQENFELTVDGCFLEIGYITQTKWLGGLVKLTDRGEIAINERCETSVPGLFAAGDVTTLPFKQIVISSGEGAKAALSAAQYISRATGREVKPDWGTGKKSNS
ncbi:FAD-dependent oxidoreductase [Candidatus Falkowbacteria bacterium]|nr:FAD-dependent oxidoreductase [Candidatus Falkowbacteria bacterium]